ncbi:hypothetical protein [Parafrankia elaeagni]|uniref:hypothetical protein n=1 Tax=Parafrankia elaeagni TaxID=222534 RepID=UPI00035E514C|nr:hypothetical protein [Parafrankia elaeagni]
MAVTVSAVSPGVGVEVAGLAGPQLVAPAVAAECQALLEKHGVVTRRRRTG